MIKRDRLKFWLVVALSGIVLAFAMTDVKAQAQTLSGYEDLSELNESPPLRNPDLDTTADVLGRRVVSPKNKVIGRVQDIQINSGGSIINYVVDFNRLKLGEPVFMSPSNLSSRTFNDRFTVDFEADDLETLYPNLLARMETASGGEAKTISVKKFQGMDVYARDGRKMGDVKQVLFDQTGSRARALYLDLGYRGVSGQSIAVPFRMIEFGHKNKERIIVLSDASADAVLALADQ